MNSRRIKDFLVFSFSTYGVLWLVLESLSLILEEDMKNVKGLGILITFLCISLFIGYLKSRPKNKIDIKIPNSDSVLEIEFGNLFNSSEAVVIPVNEFFDYKLGNHVSQQSVHGQFIINNFNNDISDFKRMTKKKLKSIQSEVIERTSGRNKRYPIGTTITLDINNCRYFLVANSKTDINTLKASCSINELWDSLSGLWKEVHHYSNGFTVKLPLIGSGLAGVGLPPQNIIEQIIMSLFYYTKEFKIANRIVIVLHPSMEKEIDLVKIERNWNNGLS